MSKSVVGVGKTLTLFVVLMAAAFGLTYADGVGGSVGAVLGYVYGSVVGYVTVITAIVRDWIVP